MLIIFNENKYDDYKKSKKKPSDFCKEDLSMRRVKDPAFVKAYFEDCNVLISSVRKYHCKSKVKNGEYTLLDLLK